MEPPVRARSASSAQLTDPPPQSASVDRMAPSHQGSLDHSSFLSTNGTGDGLGHQLSGGAHIHSALRHITICRHPFVTLLIHTHTHEKTTPKTHAAVVSCCFSESFYCNIFFAFDLPKALSGEVFPTERRTTAQAGLGGSAFAHYIDVVECC